jgi:hypothetical protein
MLISMTRSTDRRGGEADKRMLELVLQITEQFHRQRDRSRYALLNTVTATARDTREPSVRWRLEELGGAIAAALIPTRPRTPIRSTNRQTALV